jgi:hypothetical protein
MRRVALYHDHQHGRQVSTGLARLQMKQGYQPGPNEVRISSYANHWEILVAQPSRRFDANAQLQLAPPVVQYWIRGSGVQAALLRRHSKETWWGLRSSDMTRALGDAYTRYALLLAKSACVCFAVAS